MKKNPKVSIIIPCYNYGQYLQEALQSVIKQKFKDWECLIIDDGSTDDTQKIAKKFLKKDKRINFFYQKHKGLSAARNLGIKKSQGELIAFLDADDLWLPDKLSKQVTAADKRLGVGLCCTYYETIDENSKLLMKWPEIKLKKKYRQKIDLKLLCQGNFIPGSSSSTLVRASVFKKVGLFDENLKSLEDHDMWLRISLLYKIYCLPKVLLKIRIHEKAMQKNLKIMFNSTLQFIKKAKNITPQKYHQYLNNYQSYIERRISTMTVIKLFKEKKYLALFLYVLKSAFLHPLRTANQALWVLKNKLLSKV